MGEPGTTGAVGQQQGGFVGVIKDEQVSEKARYDQAKTYEYSAEEPPKAFSVDTRGMMYKLRVGLLNDEIAPYFLHSTNVNIRNLFIPNFDAYLAISGLTDYKVAQWSGCGGDFCSDPSSDVFRFMLFNAGIQLRYGTDDNNVSAFYKPLFDADPRNFFTVMYNLKHSSGQFMAYSLSQGNSIGLQVAWTPLSWLVLEAFVAHSESSDLYTDINSPASEFSNGKSAIDALGKATFKFDDGRYVIEVVGATSSQDAEGSVRAYLAGIGVSASILPDRLAVKAAVHSGNDYSDKETTGAVFIVDITPYIPDSIKISLVAGIGGTPEKVIKRTDRHGTEESVVVQPPIGSEVGVDLKFCKGMFGVSGRYFSTESGSTDSQAMDMWWVGPDIDAAGFFDGRWEACKQMMGL